MSEATPTLDLSKYIEIRLMDDMPHIRGRRIPVYTLARTYEQNGFSVSKTAEDYELIEDDVLAALLYYSENKAVIDSIITRENELHEAKKLEQAHHWKDRR